jgi:hypothetical protein
LAGEDVTLIVRGANVAEIWGHGMTDGMPYNAHKR